MNKETHDIIYKAAEALRERVANLNVSVINEDNSGIDTPVLMCIMGVDFTCYIRETVTFSLFNTILRDIKRNAVNTNKAPLLIAPYIANGLQSKFAEAGINVLDCAGNFHISHTKDETKVLLLSNSGEKDLRMGASSYPLFLEAGIKVIFYLLSEKKNVSKPYRDIQAATGVSLGAIRNIFAELTARNFLETTAKIRSLKNISLLLEQWVVSYNQILKPKLLIDRMAFRDMKIQREWASIALPDGMAWGGDCAAHLIDGYLFPGEYTIYTEVPAAYLLKTGKVTLDKSGDIFLYRRFWNWGGDCQTIPPLLVYADLMGTADGRCLEAAERILDNDLQHLK